MDLQIELHLPVELQSEFHRARIGLNIRNAPEITRILVDGVCRLVTSDGVYNRGQTPVGVRKARVLMVQSIECLPTELEVPVFADVELLRQGGIRIPKARGAEICQSRPHGRK